LAVAGSYVCVPAYVSGHPECMYHKEPGEAPRRVRLVTSMSYPWYVSAASAMAYAQACAAYAAGLMARGYDVAITTLVVCAAGGTVSIVPVMVKEYSQEPDASRIAFSTHPAMLRRAMFACWEMDPGVDVGQRNGGYGQPAYNPREVPAYIAAAFADVADERIIALPGLDVNGDKPMSYFLAMMEKAAVDTAEKVQS
jgi:hypothetical protein